MKRDRKGFDLERLLRSAAEVRDDSKPDMPFGFDTRVLAVTSSDSANPDVGITSLAQRVALLAACIIVVGSAAVYRQVSANDEMDNGLPTEYAMADTAIENGLSR